MAIRIPETQDDWRTDFTESELVARMQKLGLPSPLIQIAKGSAPLALDFHCESPVGNGIWPLQDDFVPVWTPGGTTAVGYEPSTGHFHSQHIEEIKDYEPTILRSYDKLSAWLIYHLIESGRPEEDAEIAADFLQFDKLQDLIDAKSLKSYWFDCKS